MKLIIISAIVSLLLMPIYQRFLIYVGSVETNFQQKRIPYSMGFFIFLLEFALSTVLSVGVNPYIWYSLLIITFIGTYDDLYGNKKIKGFKGHFKAFFKGKISSGFLKAVTGGLISIFLAVMFGDSIFTATTHFLIIVLLINMINIFDLRPGRALKISFVLILLLNISVPLLKIDKTSQILFGILLVVFFYDLRAKIMIGDSGANLIGLQLGIWYSLYLPIIWQWFFILILIILHIYTETKSLSELIEKNRLLKKIDLLGRKGTV